MDDQILKETFVKLVNNPAGTMIPSRLEDQPEKPADHECAALVVDTIPLIMRSIRTAIKNSGENAVSVHQFRTLKYLQHHGQASLVTLTNHLGGTAPGISKMVDHLVDVGYVTRQADGVDRRKVALSLTAEGEVALQHLRDLAISAVAGQINHLNETETSVVTLAMKVIQGAIQDRLPNDD